MMIAQTGLLVIIDLQGGGASVTYKNKMLVLETEIFMDYQASDWSAKTLNT